MNGGPQFTFTTLSNIPNCSNTPIGVLVADTSNGQAPYFYTWQYSITSALGPYAPLGPANSLNNSVAFIPGVHYIVSITDNVGQQANGYRTPETCDCSGPQMDFVEERLPECQTPGSVRIVASNSQPPYTISYINWTEFELLGDTAVFYTDLIDPFEFDTIYYAVVIDDSGCAASGVKISGSDSCEECEVTLTSKTAEVTCNL